MIAGVIVTMIAGGCASVPIEGRFLQLRDSKSSVYLQIETGTPGSCKSLTDISNWYVSPTYVQCTANSANLPWEAELYNPMLDFRAVYSALTEEGCTKPVAAALAAKQPPQLVRACKKVR